MAIAKAATVAANAPRPFSNSKIATPGALIMLVGLGVFYWGFSNFGRKNGQFGFRNRLLDKYVDGKEGSQ